MPLVATALADSCCSPLPCCVLLLRPASSLLSARRGRGRGRGMRAAAKQHNHTSSWWNRHESSGRARSNGSWSLSYLHTSTFRYRICATPDHMDELEPEGWCRPPDEIGQPLRLSDAEVARLTDAQTARTIVEVNNKSTVMISGFVGNGIYERIVLRDLPYLTDENGDIYFQVDKDEVLLGSILGNDRTVQVMIGLDNAEMLTEMELLTSSASGFGSGEISDEESDFDDDDYDEEDGFIIKEKEEEDDDDDDVSSGTLSGWSNLETMDSCHPMDFATTVADAVSKATINWLDQPPASLVAEGHLRPAFVEESTIPAGSEKDLKESGAAFFKLEVRDIHLITAYGNEPVVKIEEFRRARPDIIAHSAANIISRLRAGGERITQALKLLCWRCKAIQVEEASVIGVDSLGFDVRVCSGTLVQTLRFAFQTQATSEFSAEKQLHELLFPRLHQEGQSPQAHQKES